MEALVSSQVGIEEYVFFGFGEPFELRGQVGDAEKSERLQVDELVGLLAHGFPFSVC